MGFSMNIEERDIDGLTVPSYLNREHSEEQLERCMRSLELHGQYQPIVVSGNEIVCGVLIYTALKRLGRPTVWVNDLGDIGEERKREIRYIDNQIFDIEDWDESRLKQLLMELPSEDLDRYGFSKAETEALVNMEVPEARKDLSAWNDEWECDSCGWKGRLP
jgi:ParB-like chromosome segregation protein Spo0J